MLPDLLNFSSNFCVCLFSRRHCFDIKSLPVFPFLMTAYEESSPCVMKLTPNHAPLYGESVLSVLLDAEHTVEEDVTHYLVFSGSSQHHLTSTQRIDQKTLQTVAPAHNCCETVKVVLCASKKGLPISVLAEENFQYVQDTVHDMAQFLVSSAGSQEALNAIRIMDNFRESSDNVALLDKNLTLEVQHLLLPTSWNVLGPNPMLPASIPRETLMHFAARLGLSRLASFLLQQPGGQEALGITNLDGATPVHLATQRGFHNLEELFTQQKPDAALAGDVTPIASSEDYSVRYQRHLNVYMYTINNPQRAELNSVEHNISELQRYIQTHRCEMDTLSVPTNQTSQPELSQPIEFVENLRTEEGCKANSSSSSIAQTPIEMPAENSVCLQESMPTDEEVTDWCPEGMHFKHQENITQDSITDTKLERAAGCEDPCTNLECEGQQEEAVLMVESENIPGKTVLLQKASNGDCDNYSVSCDTALVETSGPSEQLHHNQEYAFEEDASQREMSDNMLILNNNSPDSETVVTMKPLEVKEKSIPIAENKLENVKNCVELVTDKNALSDNGGSTEEFTQLTDCHAIQLNNGSPPHPEQIAEVEGNMELTKDESSADINASMTNEANAEAGFEMKNDSLEKMFASSQNLILNSDEECEGIDHEMAVEEEFVQTRKVSEILQSLNDIEEYEQTHSTSEVLHLNVLESEPEQNDDELEVDCLCDDQWSQQVDALLETALDSNVEDHAMPMDVQSTVDLKEGASQDECIKELLSSKCSSEKEPSWLPMTMKCSIKHNEDFGPQGAKRTLEVLTKPTDTVAHLQNQEVLLSIVEEPADYMVNSYSDSEDLFQQNGKPSTVDEEDPCVMKCCGSGSKANDKSEDIFLGNEKINTISLDSKVLQHSDRKFNIVLDANGNLETISFKEGLPEDEDDCVQKLPEDLAEFVSEQISRESWGPDPTRVQPKQSANAAEYGQLSEQQLVVECPSSMPVTGDPLCHSDGAVSDESSEAADLLMKLVGAQNIEYEVSGVTTSSSTIGHSESPELTAALDGEVFLPSDAILEVKEDHDRQSLLSTEQRDSRGSAGQDNGCTVVCEAEEEKDSVADVPTRASIFRPVIRPLSPFRRHSWGPGKNTGSEAEINQRSSVRMLGDMVKRPPIHRRSMSWCPCEKQCPVLESDISYRSYSLEGLVHNNEVTKETSHTAESVLQNSRDPRRAPIISTDERGSLVSLTEEEMESDHSDGSVFDNPKSMRVHSVPPLMKSISLQAINPPNVDNLRSSTSNSLGQSISEEDYSQVPPSPTRKDLEGKGSTKVSRTFSYLKNKMSSGKHKNKEKEKSKEKEVKDKDKKTVNGHGFTAILAFRTPQCAQCNKAITSREAYLCSSCNAQVHKGCRDSLPSCNKIKQKQQKAPQAQDSSTLPTAVNMRNKTFQPKERPRSAIILQDDNVLSAPNRKMPLYRSLSKSMSIANIAGPAIDETSLASWRVLSQSTDSLNHIKQVTESMESLTDEDSACVLHAPTGTDVMDGQLMGEFESDAKELEADSWSLVVDNDFVCQQKKDVIKRQDVIYELMQTEMHHLRTLKIMSEIYSKGMTKELQFETSTVERIFPCLEDLIDIHTQFLYRILEKRKESLVANSERNFFIRKIGDILVNQFSGPSAERMKKTYGKFCGQHNDAVNFCKELLAREKKFQAFVRKKMSSSIVRRLGIQECILLVTQRITKYPVIVQRIIQHTKENDDDHADLTKALAMIKEVIAAVDNKVSEFEKKTRLQEIHSRTETKAIMRMKSGQMFAKEDLIRRKLVHDGPVTLKTSAGRLKEVQAVLLSDVLVFLQEKDQKYTFAALDQKSTVVPLQKLIVREVAHEERGMFLISAAAKLPEMYEVHASSKEERTNWMQIIQQTTSTMGQDEDEGIPSESEEDRRQLESRAKELKEKLQERDQQILSLLEEKLRLYKEMAEATGHEEASQNLITRSLFRANTEDAPKGESLLKDAMKEVEILQNVLSQSFGGAIGQQSSGSADQEGITGHVSLPRRAETFGGFDSHQMSATKSGEKDEVEDGQDLRRTESDSVLKKGLTANLILPIRKNEYVLQKVLSLQQLLLGLQAVVVQQDSFIEDQKQATSERSERLTRSSLRPSSLIEQEKQRSLEKHRQELANLKRQQALHLEEKKKWEREWEMKEKDLTEREAKVSLQDAETARLQKEVEKQREELQLRKEEYQQDLERLRTAQKQLDKEKEQLKRMEELITHQRQSRLTHSDSLSSQSSDREVVTPIGPLTEGSSSSTKLFGCNSLNQEHSEAHLMKRDVETSPSPTWKDSTQSNAKNLTSQPRNTTNSTSNPLPPRLLKLAKPKEKKSKHRKGKGHRSGNLPPEYNPDVLPTADSSALNKTAPDKKHPATELLGNEEVFYC
ncbi:A-kinase anchor protein 13-like isoform X5 [Chiloscyllium plagiosum]|uniref:A-kinase anchor protein 13-like isoform X5 n=1 Tax=Chiloscyllium plagiosum TaxID=36176 RepID=UPI001CB7C52A|nr:A-kinase anchor protein 13-like isoform X5 [Chiloscyllium plagiosum]